MGWYMWKRSTASAPRREPNRSLGVGADYVPTPMVVREGFWANHWRSVVTSQVGLLGCVMLLIPAAIDATQAGFVGAALLYVPISIGVTLGCLVWPFVTWWRHRKMIAVLDPPPPRFTRKALGPPSKA